MAWVYKASGSNPKEDLLLLEAVISVGGQADKDPLVANFNLPSEDRALKTCAFGRVEQVFLEWPHVNTVQWNIPDYTGAHQVTRRQ